MTVCYSKSNIYTSTRVLDRQLTVVSFTEQVAADVSYQTFSVYVSNQIFSVYVSNQTFSVIVLHQTEGKIQKLQIYENFE